MGTRFDVNIAGYPLTVQTERSAEHMERLTETLNGRVREIQKAGGTANYLNVVMLAAMELADDVLMSGERIEEVRQRNRELEERVAAAEREVEALRGELRQLGDEARVLRDEVSGLRTERRGFEESMDRKSRNLLAALEDALK
jgi:cell division protein ZapA (FtsZ GTPase activity inhibitor)